MNRFKWYVHNLVAHPLLVLFPWAGMVLHEMTSPDGDDGRH